MKARLFLTSCLVGLFCSLTAFAQSATTAVTGTVVDAQNYPLPGVVVQVQGTNDGVMTDYDGNYSISVKGKDAVLVYSMIGYDTAEIAVNGQKTINVTLQEAFEALEETVVVAYGHQKKESVVAAITSISSEGLVQTPASNLGIALAGRLPGLTVLQRSGVPGGENMDFYIRGRSTVNGQAPLFLVDGVERDFTALDPHEVETITVLKDASATAVYGVRGANGVILITTRRGESGKPVIDATIEQTWQDATRLPDFCSAYDYALLTNQVEVQNGRIPIYGEEALEHYRTGDFQALYPTRDMVGEFIRKGAPMQRVNLNISGGTKRMRYFTTVGYLHQQGIFNTERFDEYDYDPASKANRVNFRSNFDIDITKGLRMFLNVSGYMQAKNDPVMVPFNGSYLNDVSGYSVLIGSLFNTPNNYMNDLTPDGEVLSNSLKGGNINNVPYAMLNRSGFRNTQTNRVTTTLGLEGDLDFITKGLSVKVVASYDSYSTNQQVRQRTYQLYEAVADPEAEDGVAYIKVGTNANSTLSDSQYQQFNNLFNLDASLNYARTFGKHDVTAMFLFNRYKRTVNIELPYNYIGFVGRATYSYDRRYLAELNFGYNGSEQFAPGHKMGFFPSVSLGWVISEEEWMKDIANTLSFLKVRASFGQVGNDNMNGSRFAFLTLWSGSHEGQIGNEELTWEKANKFNAGLEIGLFNCLRIELDGFYERRNNILIPATGLIPTGMFGTGGVYESGIIPKVNKGVIDNKGFELTVSYSKQFTRDMRLDVNVNTAFNRNNVIYQSEVLLPEDYAVRLRSTGFRLGQYFGYKTAGYFNSEQDIIDWYDQSNAGAVPKVGDLKYCDENGDGIIDEKDYVPIGDPEIPEWNFGLGLGFSWKGLDFSMMWQGVAGRGNYLNSMAILETYNFNQWHKEAWSQERYEAGLPITYPRLDPNSQASKLTSDFWMINGSYLRLKNIELGYSLPKKWSQAIKAEKIRFYVNGLNLLTFDHMPVKYQDPEQNNSLLYPVFKSYNIGLNITF
ncbi:MAG: TonB-dependent receptor [Bacteroidales bacterium]|nr:TonB-dependent receptor [Bacteroidales bacterium]